MLRAVLWDVGGPIDEETEYERLTDEDIKAALTEAGVDWSDAGFREAARGAVDSFAPNAYKAIVWRLASFRVDVAQGAYDRVSAGSERRHAIRGGMELRDGIDALFRSLHRTGTPQGIVTNQPSRVLADLARHGLDHFFAAAPPRDPPIRKPSPEVFLDAAAAVEVESSSCLVVGNRIDADIVPAKLLGMETVFFRAGRHAEQQPRTWDEVPDHQVQNVSELADLLADLSLVEGQ